MNQTENIVIEGKSYTVSRVKSIEPVGSHQVYDLEVNGVHNYYAGGINVHNCMYNELLDYYIDKYDDETIYQVKDTIIRYKHRGLHLFPSGPNKRTLRGETRVIASIDEIGWFDNSAGSDDKERASAREVYTAMNNSLKTVRVSSKRLIKSGYVNVPQAYGLYISSPSSKGDMIMTMTRTFADSDEVLTIHLPTWKYNPGLRRSDFDKEYSDNPINAERDFAANPPLSASPFIYDIAIPMALMGTARNRVKYSYQIKNSHERNHKYAKLTNTNAPATMQPSVLSVDAGYSNNSFALTILSKSLTKADAYTCHVMVEVAPQVGIDTINFTLIYKNLLSPLIKAFNVQAVVADRWQSKKILTDIEEEFKIHTEEYSIDRDDFFYCKEYIEDEEKLLELPASEMTRDEIESINLDSYPHCFKYKPVAHFLYQCITVEDTGRDIVKGSGVTDDVFRAFCLGLTCMLDDEWVEEHLKDAKVQKTAALGVVGGRTGGSGGRAVGVTNNTVGAASGRFK